MDSSQKRIYAQWVRENLDRNCVEQDLRNELAKINVGVDDIEEIINMGKLIVPYVANDYIEHPKLNYNTNTISVNDRLINIVMVRYNPDIYIFDDVLSNEECNIIIEKYIDNLSDSLISGTMIGKNANDFMTIIEDRIMKLVGWDIDKTEPFNLMRYKESAEIIPPHYDWFDFTNTEIRKAFSSGGQRVGTIIQFLTDIVEGGRVEFPKLGLSIAPKAGRMIYISNINKEGKVDENSFYGENNVMTGHKFVLYKYLRENKY